MKFLFTTLFTFSIVFVQAATVDTVTIYSNAMHKGKKCVVIKPDSYSKKSNQFPTVYLLHGYAGDFSNWILKVPQIKNYSDDYQIIIVCPDGDFSSWYVDSPIDPTMKYETYIAKEVPAYIEAHYRTIKNRKARAITGLSMGGHGAFLLAFRHADFFGACGSMSGVLNLKSSATRFDISKRIGDTLHYPQNWKEYSVNNVIENYPKDSLQIIFDCGVDDFTYPDNKALHQKMLALKIPHDYTERPGNHNWAYWSNAVQYQLLFFKNYFDRSIKK